ncbi:hypothetical protein GFS24_08360 [Chitinophaga sp. SYP-B3965]|uniref:hypothetical protein n=1 Tax=Chitinophaga sp. SYP-B3965 TaxID=2663120 RepID=UPI0012995648|nr:hypothetical protein [Chitinophaga sp. SYP-B3965]MRG45124.1 hypothetical protein [Chitinophaga sp. SYP-B3965]
MKTATITELKKELGSLPPAELVELCLRLAKFKKDSKELLTYLLFEAHSLDGYITSVKEYISLEFDGLTTSHLYHAKKTLRKILRFTTKHIRFTGSKQAEIELLLFFCEKMRRSGLQIDYSVQLSNLYTQQLRKIEKAIEAQHEDLQFDYRKQLDALSFM